VEPPRRHNLSNLATIDDDFDQVGGLDHLEAVL